MHNPATSYLNKHRLISFLNLPWLRVLIILLQSIYTPSAAFSQHSNTPSDSIYSFETMHVHFDKDIYLPGETIWFKAYLYNISEISLTATNFYAAIYDENGKLIRQKQYPILGGSCNGDFEIPDSILSTRIQFRAFTKAMLQNDSNNIFQRTLTVFNKENKASNTFIPNEITLQFFPEGGQLVAEADNQIAFKAVYADGSPALIKGRIIEVERDREIDSFATNSIGSGKLMLAPSPKKTYKAVWKDAGGTTKETMLPAVNRFGVAFHTVITEKQLQYSVVKNKTSDSLNNLHVIAQMGDLEVYKANLTIPAEMEVYSGQFSIDELPAGLLQLNLFDHYWNLLQQTVVFINDQNISNNLLIKIDTVNTKAKGSNSVEIILQDTGFTSLSVSVADLGFYNKNRTHSITQDLLLNTQLTGLNINTDSILLSDKQFPDLIALTHQWKKFNWQKLRNKKEAAQPIDNYITISANYKQKNAVLPNDESLNIIMSNAGLGKQLYNLKPAEQNSFKKKDLIFFDSVKLAYQIDKNKVLTDFITIQREDTLKIPATINALPHNISFTVNRPAAGDSPMNLFYDYTPGKFNSVKTIKEVVVKSKYKGNPVLDRIDELDRFYTSGMFSGTTKGFQLNVIDDTVGVATNRDLREYLRYRLPGMTLRNGSFGVYRTKLTATLTPSGEYSNSVKTVFIPLLIFINEVNMTVGLPEDTMGGVKSGGGDPLELLQMNDIAYVKYVPNIVIGGSFVTSEGALYVYTKTGREKGPVSKGLPFVYIKGYTAQKEFILPDYTDKTNRLQPDIRSTLYWKPDLLMDKENNRFRFNFYNNDISKKLLLKIEGVTASGRLIYIEKIIQ